MGAPKKAAAKHSAGKNEKRKQNQNAPPPPQSAPPQEQDLSAASRSREKKLDLVRMFWEERDPEDRRKLLRIPVEDLKAWCAKLDADSVASLEEGLARLSGKGTWKSWHCLVGAEPVVFDTVDEFRKHLQEQMEIHPGKQCAITGIEPVSGHCYRSTTRSNYYVSQAGLERAEAAGAGPFEREVGVPPLRDDSRGITAAERNLRERMAGLMEKVKQVNQQYQEELARARVGERTGRRMTQEQINDLVHRNNVENITLLLEGLQHEEGFLHDACLNPILNFVHMSLSSDVRRSTELELDFTDLDQLSPQDVASIFEFVSDKVQEYGAERPDPSNKKDTMDDVDLFGLSEDGKEIVVNSTWLQHLEQRRMGENGRICKLTEDGEEVNSTDGESATIDCEKGGLVLDWIYLKIVNTAEKARVLAQTRIGGAMLPKDVLTEMAKEAYQELVRCVSEQHKLREQKNRAKQLLGDLIRSRAERAENPLTLTETEADDPTEVTSILRHLEREELLTTSKLYVLTSDITAAQEAQKLYNAKLAKGHPEFKRLQQELDNFDRSLPRHVEGHFRSSAEMERHRQQLVDQANEEHMELMQELKSRSAELNHLMETREQARRQEEVSERERKQLEGWRQMVRHMSSELKEVGPAGTKTPEELRNSRTLARTQFHNEIKKQLYSDKDDKMFFDKIKNKMAEMEKQLEKSSAALVHQELRLLNLACVDPGATIGTTILLPFLQERIEGLASNHASNAAQAAQEQLLLEEVKDKKPKEKSEEKKKKKKDKKGGASSGISAGGIGGVGKEVAGATPATAEVDPQEAMEEERQRRSAAMAAEREMRRAEEERALEERRQQLMAEGGHWKLRADLEQQERILREALNLKEEDGCTASWEEREKHEMELLMRKLGEEEGHQYPQGSGPSHASSSSSSSSHQHESGSSGSSRPQHQPHGGPSASSAEGSASHHNSSAEPRGAPCKEAPVAAPPAETPAVSKAPVVAPAAGSTSAVSSSRAGRSGVRGGDPGKAPASAPGKTPTAPAPAPVATSSHTLSSDAAEWPLPTACATPVAAASKPVASSNPNPAPIPARPPHALSQAPLTCLAYRPHFPHTLLPQQVPR
ncbi:hypothetical protein CYMTET_51912 [Cymbomonas tetramitiformis]|uniref:DUF629 domain-containing protein n=1 Tax=Cymbomonas tetramitiformis TaxID=36881 RepID=A0AAE0BL90_9CHLO|nr:hypothetical protein CYMTET_51912 [Cymbomonas tetramitiformis]